MMNFLEFLIYIIESSIDFNLYVNLLVPKSSNPSGRSSVDIFRIKEGTKILLNSLDGGKGEWKEFYEEFVGDYYLQGPELRKRVSAGRYKIIVFNDGNRGKYVLAVGETEKFGPSDLPAVFTVLPALKKNFFEVSILTLLQAKLRIIFIIGILALIVLLAVLIIVGYKKVWRNS
jgi:hypothetical protein